MTVVLHWERRQKFLLLLCAILLSGGMSAQSLLLTLADLQEKYADENVPRYFYRGLPYTGQTTDRFPAEKKIITYDFVDGYIELQTGWDFEGRKVRHFPYRNGRPHGKLISYYNNGQKYYEVDYIDGKAHGMEYGWYRDGSKRLEVKYVNGTTLYKLEYPKPEGH